jgi:hypothetical protein
MEVGIVYEVKKSKSTTRVIMGDRNRWDRLYEGRLLETM